MNQLKLIQRLLKIKGVILEFHLDELLEDVPKLKYFQWFLLFSFKKWFRDDQNEPIAVRIRKAMEKLGPLYVKFGQSLSTRPDLLPDDIAMELSKLQDDVPPFEATLAELEIKNAFGKPSSELFDRFDPVAFASASIAQAHSAQLKTGEEVIVKILRPNIIESLEDDFAILFLLAKLVDGYSKESKRLRPLEVVTDYQKTVLNELDLMREAANCAQIGRNWQGSDIIKVPKIYWDFCRQNILVQERIFGIPINDIEALEAAGINIKQLALNGVEIFFTQVFHHNLFHADMHPGNVFVDITDPKKPLYAAVDFGIVGKDTLLETDLSNHLRIKDLNIASCKMVIAGKKGTKLMSNMKVATKYPSITKKYFQSKGIPCSVLKLYGSIELASVLGMSDVIVDLVESGQTLKQNGLVEIETIEKISSVLIVNKTSYKVNREQINKFFNKINLDQ